MTIRLTITAKGQITLCEGLLNHLGASPDDELEVDLLEGQRLQVRRRKRTSVETIFGLLKRPSSAHLTIDEINQITAAAWAGER